MHNIKTNFGRFYQICKEFFEEEAASKSILMYQYTVNAFLSLRGSTSIFDTAE
ncbi:hypothetical protein CLV53_1247 [Sediminibacterium magnilacihabitans]|jgi:hypothetical protein|nr:hypothetical protein CLV53_1247 [Sediminibacterium magnilacihabitans]